MNKICECGHEEGLHTAGEDSFCIETKCKCVDYKEPATSGDWEAEFTERFGFYAGKPKHEMMTPNNMRDFIRKTLLEERKRVMKGDVRYEVLAERIAEQERERLADLVKELHSKYPDNETGFNEALVAVLNVIKPHE